MTIFTMLVYPSQKRFPSRALPELKREWAPVAFTSEPLRHSHLSVRNNDENL